MTVNPNMAVNATQPPAQQTQTVAPQRSRWLNGVLYGLAGLAAAGATYYVLTSKGCGGAAAPTPADQPDQRSRSGQFNGSFVGRANGSDLSNVLFRPYISGDKRALLEVRGDTAWVYRVEAAPQQAQPANPPAYSPAANPAGGSP